MYRAELEATRRRNSEKLEKVAPLLLKIVFQKIHLWLVNMSAS